MIAEHIIPPGWRRATYGDALKPYMFLCNCERREIALPDADSHRCSWVMIVRDEEAE